MTKILANDGISQAGIDALTAKGFEVITEKVNQEDLISSTNYGIDFCSIISNKNIFGTQFHPEKSSKIGLKILENFLNA